MIQQWATQLELLDAQRSLWSASKELCRKVGHARSVSCYRFEGHGPWAKPVAETRVRSKAGISKMSRE
ncbi:unnamed protein product [Phytophthora fragariaefolia]|uniref:Unnamed protein product n=1 Tax=Phytophthora fragariaefolia TaxID=1490495 RepID=A0A9W6XLA0_9STRA|nr:unnamed protein product [Phytophthora fragariaefolia]